MQADKGRLFVANSVTIGKRVRLDILKTIAQKCSNDRKEFFVMGFTSRPVLQVRRRDNSGQYALTFADAVSKFRAGLSKGELQVAYGRAGDSFAGQLQQNFVVLHEKWDRKGQAERKTGPGATGQAGRGGKKRGNEEARGRHRCLRRGCSGGVEGVEEVLELNAK